MKTTRLLHLGVSGLALFGVACGAAKPTPELQTARNVYAQARNGEAAQLNPKGVHEAYKALQSAEAVHDDDGGSMKERHLAYVATRKSELAIAQASEALARKEQERADESYKAGLEQRSEKSAEQSSQYAQQLTQTQQQLQANTQALQERDRKLQEVQAAAQRAEQELRQMESMREEAGRLIISLSGVLFETGGDQLSANAQGRLDTVANALAAYPDRNILIEGYTDAQGSDEANRQLSQRRADAVRAHLESRGVPSERLRSIGKGETSPVASNDTPEGRANNRRVEIVIEPARQARDSNAPAQNNAQQTGSSPSMNPPGQRPNSGAVNARVTSPGAQ